MVPNRICLKCKGTGQILTPVRCSKCYGKGTVKKPTFSSYFRIYRKYTIMTYVPGPCEQCQGKGVQHQYAQCPNCRGRGRV